MKISSVYVDVKIWRNRVSNFILILKVLFIWYNKCNITINVTVVTWLMLFSLSTFVWMNKFNYVLSLLLLFVAFTGSKIFKLQKMWWLSVPIDLLQSTGQCSFINRNQNILFISLYHWLNQIIIIIQSQWLQHLFPMFCNHYYLGSLCWIVCLRCLK